MNLNIARLHRILLPILSIALIAVYDLSGHLREVYYNQMAAHALLSSYLSSADSVVEHANTAVTYAEAAIELNPNLWEGYRILGRAHSQQQQFLAARESTQAYVDALSTNTFAQNELINSRIVIWQYWNDLRYYDFGNILPLGQIQVGEDAKPILDCPLNSMVDHCLVMLEPSEENASSAYIYQGVGSVLRFQVQIPDDETVVLRLHPSLEHAVEINDNVLYSVSVSSQANDAPLRLFEGILNESVREESVTVNMGDFQGQQVTLSFEVAAQGSVSSDDIADAAPGLVWKSAVLEPASASVYEFVLPELKPLAQHPNYVLTTRRNALIAFTQGDYAEALGWYKLYEFGAPNRASARFETTLAAILSDPAQPRVIDSTAVYIHSLKSAAATVISGQDLQWMKEDTTYGLDYGQSMKQFPLGNAPIGVMWWDGTVVAVVHSDGPASYLLTLRAQHSKALPATLQIKRDFELISEVQVNEGWQDYQIPLGTLAGFNVISVSYIENSADAYIDWLRLEPVENDNALLLN